MSSEPLSGRKFSEFKIYIGGPYLRNKLIAPNVEP